VTNEGKEEAKEYDKFACFCKDQASDKLYAIEKSEKVIKELSAKIEKLETEIEELDADVKTLGERIEEIEGTVEEKEAARKKEHEEYEEEADDIKDAIDAIDRAMKKLTGAKDKLEGDADKDFVQVLANTAMYSRPGSKTPETVQKVIALIQGNKPGEAHAYNYKSNDVIDILRNLRRDFKTELKDVDEEEHDAKASHEKKMLALNNEKKFKDKEKTEKEELSSEKSEELSEAEEDKESEETAKGQDDEFMEELTTQCEDKAEVWDQRSKTRAGELTALSKAIDAMKTGAVGNYDSAKSALVEEAQKVTSPVKVPIKSALSFLQVRDGSAAVITNVVALLQSEAKRLSSEKLGKIADLVQMKKGFSAVKALIDDMIAKLQDEATAEANSEDFCATGLEDAMKERDDNNIAIEEAEANIAKDGAEIKGLKAEVGDHMEELSTLHKEIGEAQELRNEEKASNQKTLDECEEGKEATETALTVLKEFYEGAKLLQQSKKSPGGRDGKSVDDLIPETSFDGDYKGKQKQSGSVIGLIEIILEDFENTIESTQSAEDKSQKEFEDMNKEALASIDEHETGAKEKKSEIKELTEAITQAKDDIIEAKELRDSALEELEKLQAMCVEGAESFEERAKQREGEIKSLQAAKTLLDEFTAK